MEETREQMNEAEMMTLRQMLQILIKQSNIQATQTGTIIQGMKDLGDRLQKLEMRTQDKVDDNGILVNTRECINPLGRQNNPKYEVGIHVNVDTNMSTSTLLDKKQTLDIHLLTFSNEKDEELMKGISPEAMMPLQIQKSNRNQHDDEEPLAMMLASDGSKSDKQDMNPGKCDLSEYTSGSKSETDKESVHHCPDYNGKFSELDDQGYNASTGGDSYTGFQSDVSNGPCYCGDLANEMSKSSISKIASVKWNGCNFVATPLKSKSQKSPVKSNSSESMMESRPPLKTRDKVDSGQGSQSADSNRNFSQLDNQGYSDTISGSSSDANYGSEALPCYSSDPPYVEDLADEKSKSSTLKNDLVKPESQCRPLKTWSKIGSRKSCVAAGKFPSFTSQNHVNGSQQPADKSPQFINQNPVKGFQTFHKHPQPISQNPHKGFQNARKFPPWIGQNQGNFVHNSSTNYRPNHKASNENMKNMQFDASKDTTRGPWIQNTRNQDTTRGPWIQNTRNQDTTRGPWIQNTRNQDTTRGPWIQNTRNQETTRGPWIQNTRNPDTTRGPWIQNTRNQGNFVHNSSMNYRPNHRASNENMKNMQSDASKDITRGPRIQNTSKPKDTLELTLDRNKYNRGDFITDYPDAKFYVIKSYSEDDVYKSIKFDVWSSTDHGNKKLNDAFIDMMEKSNETRTKCPPTFLFFSVNTSGQFLGVAEMIGRIDFNKTMDFWQVDKWNGFFPVKWHILKDIPNAKLRHIILKNNQNKNVTFTRDTQEIELEEGLQMLKIFKDYEGKTSLLDDVDFYEDRIKLAREKAKSLKKKDPESEIYRNYFGEDYGEDYRDYGEDYKDYAEDYKDYGDDYQDHGEDYQDHGEDFQDHGEEYQEHGEDYQDHGEDYRDHGEDYRDHGEDYRDYGEEF